MAVRVPSMLGNIRKLLRFAAIYGPRRALFKAAGRMRLGRVAVLGVWPWPRRRDIGVVGCGQFAFATIGYVVATRLGNRIGACYDPDRRAAATFARFFGCRRAESAADIFADPGIRFVYVASPHSTHTAYAVAAFRVGKSVYVEKPVAVTVSQMGDLLDAKRTTRGKLFAGYNRPFSPAIRDLKARCVDLAGPLTLSCIIAGHMIPAGHWYRDPAEGTRICGNVGHWLDLAVHILSWRGLPADWRLACEWSDAAARDDNLAVTLSSNCGDLVSIVMTSRSEPFEGISETIVLQWGEVTATIDDFRRLTVREGAKLSVRKYWPKDVGHAAAILQPFGGQQRDFAEVEASTRLMLAIADMVREGERARAFSFAPRDLRMARESTAAGAT